MGIPEGEPRRLHQEEKSRVGDWPGGVEKGSSSLRISRGYKLPNINIWNSPKPALHPCDAHTLQPDFVAKAYLPLSEILKSSIIGKAIDTRLKSKRMTSLHIAVMFGGNKLTRALLEDLKHDQAELLRLINLNVEGYGTPLDTACRCEQLDMIDLLAAHGADVNPPAPSPDELPILHEAVLHGRLGVVASLAKAGADLNAEVSTRGMTIRPIILAMLRDNAGVEMLQLLINRGANVNYITMTGNTPLIAAIASQSLPTVKLLVSAGADVNWGEGTQMTVLKGAIQTGNLDLVICILKAGANIDGRDSSGETALFHAALQGSEAIVKALVDRGATIDATGKTGLTPLCAAKALGHDGIARLLTDAGADQAILKRLRTDTDPEDGGMIIRCGEVHDGYLWAGASFFGWLGGRGVAGMLSAAADGEKRAADRVVGRIVGGA
ncbi:hypothetical protein MAPG_10739 [Magnaporthiopsis poae ATCC 64411]|uniref:Uncharacterized protein n=1 Tax=Magnaporthiopsis poae (strain ATCC 64411 / 73-15) TaxID=644358 RepID=A0A0C4EDE1_MAGP6|nr:hypothetical protein MAPG_10739 [Magnaporthiopsis poae ATCC 64411]